MGEKRASERAPIPRPVALRLDRAVDGLRSLLRLTTARHGFHCGKVLLARTAFVRQINDLERRNVRPGEGDTMKRDYRLQGASVLLLLGAAGASHAAPIACNALLNTTIEGATITTAQLNPAGGGLPDHCEVLGVINPRTGVDGQPYAIKLHLRMPTAWNERFYFQGGGGTDGNLGTASPAQLGQGYAVVSTDGGHDNAVNTTPLAGSFQFGFDPQARSDYGYNAHAQVANAAKAITKTYYRHTPKFSYFEGCSEGGREGLMFSQRYPEMFDGIVAGNPGMDLPKAAVAEAWDSQAFAAAARTMTPFGNPDLASSFTPAELSAVGDAILQACDAQDGLVDGMVNNPQACRFDPADTRPVGQRSPCRRAGHRAREGVRWGEELEGQVALRRLVLGSGRRGSRLARLEDRAAVSRAGQHVAEHDPRRRRPPVHLHHATELGDRGHGLEAEHRHHDGRPQPGLRRTERCLRPLGAQLQHGSRRAEDLRGDREVQGVGDGLHGHELHRLPGLPHGWKEDDRVLRAGRPGVLVEISHQVVSTTWSTSKAASTRRSASPACSSSPA